MSEKDALLGLLRDLNFTPQQITRNSGFGDRLRVQKAVFFLKHLNVSPFTEYSFSMYLRGPYSSELARDYYNLSGTQPAPILVEQSDWDRLTWFMQHNNNWLEIASSILSIKERYTGMNREGIHDVLLTSKPWVTNERFETIIGELEHKGL